MRKEHFEWIKRNFVILLSLMAFFWIFLLSYHIPWMYADETTIMNEAAKGFSFPEGQSLGPRFVYMYAYKIIFFIFGFNYFYFHLFKAILAAILIYFYFKIASKFVGEKLSIMACLTLLFTSPFVFTSIWISEQITMALTTQLITIYILLFSEKKIKNYLLLFLALFAAIFSKETNLILLPLLSYYFITRSNLRERSLIVIPVLFALFYKLLITTRLVHFDVSNFWYFQNVLSKYFTFILLLVVLIYVIYKIFSIIKSREILKYDDERFLVVWYILGLVMLLFGHNQEERYIVEVLPVFLILSILSVKQLFGTLNTSEKSKKLMKIILGVIIVYFVVVNGYGIIKTEYGWGNMFKAFEEISQKIDDEYPNSLVLYPSVTQDFFSDFRKFEVLSVASDFNVSSLDKNSSRYNKIFYIQYPKRIRQFEIKDLSGFNNPFNVTKGIYTFEVYELNSIRA